MYSINILLVIISMHYNYVTGFAKTIPIGTTIEI